MGLLKLDRIQERNSKNKNHGPHFVIKFSKNYMTIIAYLFAAVHDLKWHLIKANIL